MRTTQPQIKRLGGRPRNPRTILTTTDIEGEQLRTFAKLTGWSLESLAYSAGVDYSTMRQYVNGHRRIPNHRIERIATLLGIYPQQIRPTYQPTLEMQVSA
jgi:transcriptional regulator with XRE-family HTH domain